MCAFHVRWGRPGLFVLVMAAVLAVVVPSAATPAGYGLVEGTATGTDLDGYPAQVVYETPIDESTCQVMSFIRPSRIMVRIYLIEDVALAGSGLGVGQYISDVVGVDNHDYGLLWIGSQIDHDGNTAPDGVRANWRPRGFSGSDVYNVSNTIKFGVNPDTGNFSWWEWENDADTWRDGSPVPDGYSPYVSWKSQDGTARTLPTVAFEDLGCTDTDGDSIFDFNETTGCEATADCDDDGVPDNEEPAGCGTNPDCDSDGVTDGLEPEGCIEDPTCTTTTTTTAAPTTTTTTTTTTTPTTVAPTTTTTTTTTTVAPTTSTTVPSQPPAVTPPANPDTSFPSFTG